MIKLLAAAAMLTPTTQVAAPPACLDRTDVREITYFLLPIGLHGLAEKCAAVLPPDAFLLNGGRALSARLAAESATHWRGAMAAFLKLSGEKLPAGLSQATITSLFEDMVRDKFVGKLSPGDCADINEAAELLAPLPPENIGGLVRLLIRVSERDEHADKGKDVHICPDPAR